MFIVYLLIILSVLFSSSADASTDYEKNIFAVELTKENFLYHEHMTAFLEKNKYSESFKSLSLDGFKIISEWYYFAILSVMELDNYNGATDCISEALSLGLDLVEGCLRRLLK